MPVQFTNLRAKVFSVLGFPAGFTPNEVVIGAVDGLAQVSGLGSAGNVLTSQGAGSPPHWAAGGGGGGGLAQMPWNLLGGWVGSAFDPAWAIDVGGGGNPNQGQICAIAVTVDTATAFSKVIFLGAVAQTGTGAIVVVTDSAGNWVAHATNADTAFQGITLSAQYVVLDLNTSVTPSAAQEVFYVQVLWPASVSVTPELYYGPNDNWYVSQSEVAFADGANDPGFADTTIPNPSPVSGLTSHTLARLWCAVA